MANSNIAFKNEIMSMIESRKVCLDPPYRSALMYEMDLVYRDANICLRCPSLKLLKNFMIDIVKKKRDNYVAYLLEADKYQSPFMKKYENGYIAFDRDHWLELILWKQADDPFLSGDKVFYNPETFTIERLYDV